MTYHGLSPLTQRRPGEKQARSGTASPYSASVAKAARALETEHSRSDSKPVPSTPQTSCLSILHPHPRILENRSFQLSLPLFVSLLCPHLIPHPRSFGLHTPKLPVPSHSTCTFAMDPSQNQPPSGVPGPTARRLHIAHRRSPSELTPLMSMFSSPGSKFFAFF
jgi:hypothetical protein